MYRISAVFPLVLARSLVHPNSDVRTVCSRMQLCPAPAASHVAEIASPCLALSPISMYAFGGLRQAKRQASAAIILQRYCMHACSAITASQPGRRPRGPHVFMQKQHQHTVHTAYCMHDVRPFICLYLLGMHYLCLLALFASLPIS